MQHLRLKMMNFGWLGAEQLVRLGIGLLVMTLVARKLGPDDFAIYSYILAAFSIVAPLVRFGTNVTVLREVVRQPDKVWPIVAIALMITVPLALVTSLAVGGVVLLSDPFDDFDTALILAGSLLLLAVPGDIAIAVLRAQERVRALALARIVIAILVAIGTAWFALTDGGLLAFTTLRGSEALVLALAGFAVLLWKKGAARSAPWRSVESLPLLRDGLPLMLTSLFVFGMMRVDQIMLGQAIYQRELGLYSVAVRVAEVAAFLPVVLFSTLYPAIVRAFTNAPSEFDEYSQRILDVFSLAGWVASLALAVVAVFLLVPIFGEPYADAVQLTLWLLCATPFIFVQTAISSLLSARGWVWMSAGIAGAGMALNVVLNLWLIPRYGATGAAWATLLTYVAIALPIPLLLQDLRPMGRAVFRAINPVAAVLRLGGELKMQWAVR